MLRRLLAVVLAVAVFVGGLLAAEGTVVKFGKGTLTVKVDGKEKEFKLNKKTHVHDAEGKEVKGKNRAKALKEGVKVKIEEKGGEVTEVNIQK